MLIACHADFVGFGLGVLWVIRSVMCYLYFLTVNCSIAKVIGKYVEINLFILSMYRLLKYNTVQTDLTISKTIHSHKQKSGQRMIVYVLDFSLFILSWQLYWIQESLWLRLYRIFSANLCRVSLGQDCNYLFTGSVTVVSEFT